MKISLVILTFNQKELTLRCLRALDGYISPEREIILVDNGSTDGTADEVRRLHPHVRLVISPRNIGVAPGRNLGLAAATGDLLMLLDNDTIASTATVTSMADWLNARPDVGLLAPQLVSPQGEVQRSFKPFPGLGLKMRNMLLRRRTDTLPPGSNPALCEPFYVIGAAQMFTRAVFEEAGPLDNRIFYGPEDADFCMAVRATGRRVVYNPAFTIIHDWQRRTNSRPLSPIGRRHIRALLYFYRKHRRWF